LQCCVMGDKNGGSFFKGSPRRDFGI